MNNFYTYPFMIDKHKTVQSIKILCSSIGTWLLWLLIIFYLKNTLFTESLYLIDFLYEDGLILMTIYTFLKIFRILYSISHHYMVVVIYSLIIYTLGYGLTNPLRMMVSFLHGIEVNIFYHTLIIIFLWEKYGLKIYS
jgi:hypothetical protein